MPLARSDPHSDAEEMAFSSFSFTSGRVRANERLPITGECTFINDTIRGKRICNRALMGTREIRSLRSKKLNILYIFITASNTVSQNEEIFSLGRNVGCMFNIIYRTII